MHSQRTGARGILVRALGEELDQSGKALFNAFNSLDNESDDLPLGTPRFRVIEDEEGL